MGRKPPHQKPSSLPGDSQGRIVNGVSSTWRSRAVSGNREPSSHRMIQRCERKLRTINRRALQPKTRKRVHPAYRKTTVLKHIPGCRGLWSELARRLNCSINTVQRAMSQEGWEWVREAFEEEKLRAKEMCAKSMYDLAQYAESSQVRFSATSFILDRTHPDFQKNSKVTVEGGSKPIRSIVLSITPEMIQNLPVDESLKLLEQLEEDEGGD